MQYFFSIAAGAVSRGLLKFPEPTALRVLKNEVNPQNWTSRDVKLIGDHCSISRSVMTGTKERQPAAFTGRVAPEAAKPTKTLAELSEAFQVRFAVPVAGLSRGLPLGVLFSG
jgi:hypothetical protein